MAQNWQQPKKMDSWTCNTTLQQHTDRKTTDTEKKILNAKINHTESGEHAQIFGIQTHTHKEKERERDTHHRRIEGGRICINSELFACAHNNWRAHILHATTDNLTHTKKKDSIGRAAKKASGIECGMQALVQSKQSENLYFDLEKSSPG